MLQVVFCSVVTNAIPECRGTPPPPKGRNISSDLCKSHESSLRRVGVEPLPQTPPPVALRPQQALYCYLQYLYQRAYENN